MTEHYTKKKKPTKITLSKNKLMKHFLPVLIGKKNKQFLIEIGSPRLYHIWSRLPGQIIDLPPQCVQCGGIRWKAGSEQGGIKRREFFCHESGRVIARGRAAARCSSGASRLTSGPAGRARPPRSRLYRPFIGDYRPTYDVWGRIDLREGQSADEDIRKTGWVEEETNGKVIDMR